MDFYGDGIFASNQRLTALISNRHRNTKENDDNDITGAIFARVD